ncbi:MAG: hypothetical protein HC853_04580 [Anaerolineae bacterium]|nr:hypothetical protein [Anaerolineae bacterium]
MNVIQRLRPLARTLAYELLAVDGVNLLRDAVTSYVTGGRDHNVVLVDRDRDGIEAFGLMHILRDGLHAPNNSHNTNNGDRSATQHRAALILMAPGPQSDESVESWMYLAREFCAYAAAHGVHHVIAEPPEYGGEAEALHGAGFAPLIHQDVLKLPALEREVELTASPLGMREAVKADEPLIRMLHMRNAPKMTYQAEITSDLLRATTPSDEGWVLVQHNEVVGHVAIREGKRGYGLQLMFRPKAEEMAKPMLQHALGRIGKRRRGPVYCTVRAYQSWVLPVLDDLGFSHVTSTVLWCGIRRRAYTNRCGAPSPNRPSLPLPKPSPATALPLTG